MKYKNKYITGVLNPILNEEIIKNCDLKNYSSKCRLLEHFYHVDTYKDNERMSYRLQGYVYPDELYNDNQISQIEVPPCEVAYMNDRLILFVTIRIAMLDPFTS